MDIAVWGDEEYSGSALGVSNLEHQIWREINFSVMFCFVLCNSIQLFTPHQALLYLVGLYRTSAFGGLGFISIHSRANHRCQPLCFHVTLCRTGLLMFFPVEAFFFPPRQNFMLSQKRKWKIKKSMYLSDIFLCLYSKLNIIKHCVCETKMSLDIHTSSSLTY